MAIADLLLLNVTNLQAHQIDVAVVDGRIAEISPSGHLSYRLAPTGTVIEGGGRLLTPGLWDAHIHLYHWCQSRHQLALDGCASREDLLAKVAQAPPGEGWLLGQGWNNTAWPDRRPPDRLELDRLTGSRPTLLWCSDLHSVLANTAALEKADLLRPGVLIAGGAIEREADGSPTGWLKEMAANHARQVVPSPSHDELKKLLLAAAEELVSYGITGVCDQRIKAQDDGPAIMAALLELSAQGLWPLRTSVNLAAHHLEQAVALGLKTGFGSDTVRFGHLKLFADGALGSRTARMLMPFTSGGSGEDGRGLYLTSPEEMREVIARAAHTGWSVSVHAIGDEANRVCLDLFEELERGGAPRPLIPHRIEHVQFLDDADLPRLAALDLTASVQAGHLIDDREAANDALGTRARLAYRFGDLFSSGTRLAFGSDAPVSRVDPHFGFQAALHRRWGEQLPWYENQRLPAEAVWDGYTQNAAQAAGWDDLTGRLQVGLRADLVLWERDPSQSREGTPAQASHTIFDGRIAFPQSS